MKRKRNFVKIICKKCNKDKYHEAKGFCHGCYEAESKKMRKPKLIVCVECKETKQHKAKKMCSNCYNKVNYTKEYHNRKQKEYYFENRNKCIIRVQTRKLHNTLKKVCVKCGNKLVLEIHHLNYTLNEEDILILCRKCHYEEHKQTSMLKKECGVK